MQFCGWEKPWTLFRDALLSCNFGIFLLDYDFSAQISVPSMPDVTLTCFSTTRVLVSLVYKLEVKKLLPFLFGGVGPPVSQKVTAFSESFWTPVCKLIETGMNYS